MVACWPRGFVVAADLWSLGLAQAGGANPALTDLAACSCESRCGFLLGRRRRRRPHVANEQFACNILAVVIQFEPPKSQSGDLHLSGGGGSSSSGFHNSANNAGRRSTIDNIIEPLNCRVEFCASDRRTNGKAETN